MFHYYFYCIINIKFNPTFYYFFRFAVQFKKWILREDVFNNFVISVKQQLVFGRGWSVLTTGDKRFGNRYVSEERGSESIA